MKKKHCVRSGCELVFCKKVFLKIQKNHREIPVLKSLSNTVKDFQVVRIATLLKGDAALVSQYQSFVDHLQNRCS